MTNRIRSIFPEILESEDFASWSPWAQIGFVKIWTKMDDKGRIKDNSRWLAPLLFPFNREIDGPRMSSLIDEWVATGSACRYQADGESWVHCVNWAKFQRPNRPTPSKIPPCPLHDGSLSTHESLTDGSPPEGRGGERRGEEGSARGTYPDRCARHARIQAPPKCGDCADVRKARAQLAEIAAAPLSRCLIHATVYKGACPGCAADEKAAQP